MRDIRKADLTNAFLEAWGAPHLCKAVTIRIDTDGNSGADSGDGRAGRDGDGDGKLNEGKESESAAPQNSGAQRPPQRSRAAHITMSAARGGMYGAAALGALGLAAGFYGGKKGAAVTRAARMAAGKAPDIKAERAFIANTVRTGFLRGIKAGAKYGGYVGTVAGALSSRSVGRRDQSR